MKVSVVVCAYSTERYDVLRACLESVIAQTHSPLEIVVVIDGNEELYGRVRNAFDDHDGIVFHLNERNRGISYSRTKGAALASGEIVAMIDDDAVAEPTWIERHVDVYDDRGAIAVAGPVEPDWLEGKPSFFPPEFYWLVGCTEPGFASEGEEIRNGYGSNISYRRDAFLEVGGYDVNTGRRGGHHIQAHEPPVCLRLRERFDTGVIYTERAVVTHRLFAYRGEFGWLVRRSFWQGYSKRIMDDILDLPMDEERGYLLDLATSIVPRRVAGLLRRPSTSKLTQLLAIFVFTAAVGTGYLYALTKPTTALVDEEEEPAPG